jgi:protein SCO1/2
MLRLFCIRTIATVLLSTCLLLAGCGSDADWQTKDISGLMPELAFTLTSENGKTVSAEDYTGKVDLLFFGYTYCPDVCPVTLGRLRAALEQLDPGQREQVRVLFVSVDPNRDDPALLKKYTSVFGPAFIGLTGTTEQLDALTRRYRTTYGYGEPNARGDYEVTHSSAIFAFDKQGEVRLLMRISDSVTAIAEDIKQLLRLG